ncbi:SWIM zinc finger family protein [Thalassospira xiamenensis]|uniref:SWIM zinc finger family protein n=1 Tax=Thalassospira xiamenensis TaxID=220697 RepID=UPI001E301E97|nr:SWIM zinc finger family protein [Thalassospira xiamenensis]MCD1593332.1 SWIM zinc finger family protein [Thalassospira xiamenensis]
MQKLTFQIQGSADEPYIVTFEKPSDGNLNAYCTCPAGQNGQYCKHRFGLLNGEVKNIVSGNKDDLPTLADMFKGSDVETTYLKVIQLENETTALKKKLGAAKKDLATAMLR